ncbi:hypothetical protein SAMN06265368_0237 [Cohaesibacter gelatinilyticus]|uniref:Uncharacterized protein n=1 Tax=Cohaesibacter gelatinilyticus TaxID=372072 RepID=A0A285N8V7_9HYPH|nr:hypothetical protein SAMN06265368_0237 [Cohaesibacter gelatinilyticus]
MVVIEMNLPQSTKGKQDSHKLSFPWHSIQFVVM